MQIYADNAATTKMSEAAIETMTDCVRNWYGSCLECLIKSGTTNHYDSSLNFGVYLGFIDAQS